MVKKKRQNKNKQKEGRWDQHLVDTALLSSGTRKSFPFLSKKKKKKKKKKYRPTPGPFIGQVPKMEPPFFLVIMYPITPLVLY